jgi:tRNA(Ile)-lysidine synthase
LRQLTTLDPEQLFAPYLRDASRVLVAVSGGPDSQALLHLLAQWPAHPPLLIATVDHGLRPESAAEAQMVADTAAKLELPHLTLVWEGDKPSTGLGAAARNARYALLEALAARENCSHLITAHHRDDQAETVLMRLMAGSGPAGLAAMRVTLKRGSLTHLRPLLNTPKVALLAYCAAHDIPFATDPSNTNPRFGRGRLRQSAAALKTAGITNARLAKLAERMADMDDAIEASTHAALVQAGVVVGTAQTTLNWLRLEAQPVALRRRALSRLIAQVADVAPLKLEKLERLESELHAAGQAGLALRRTLAECVVSLSKRGELTIMKAPPRKSSAAR